MVVTFICIFILNYYFSPLDGKIFLVQIKGEQMSKRDSSSDYILPQEINNATSSKSSLINQTNELFEDFWNWRIERSPEFASMSGSKKFNNKLEIFTEKRFIEDVATCKSFLKRTEKLSNLKISMEQRFKINCLKNQLETFIDGFPHKGFYFPVSSLEGVQVEFTDLAKWSSPKTFNDYIAILERYHAFFDYVSQVIKMMQKGIENGLTNHKEAMDGVVEQCKEHLGNVKETVFYEPFKNLSQLSQTEQKSLQLTAASIIKKSIQPGFQKLLKFLKRRYIKATRKDIGAGSLSPTFYEACLKFHTNTNLTAAEIHKIGLDEVERIENQMNNVKKELGYGKLTLRQFIRKVNDDPENYFNSKEELLKAANNTIEHRIKPKLQIVLKNLPRTNMEIVENEKTTATAASYTAGTPNGRPGILKINAHIFGTFSKFSLLALMLHESFPGHHVDGSYSIEDTSRPAFMQIKEDRIYGQVPSRFPLNTGFSEGWGLYSEQLGYDMGLYDDPLDRFGQLTYDMYRSTRLVVDTGIHALNWTKEEAFNYMFDRLSYKEEKVWREIRRYITWPGQATAYKIGQLCIMRMRKKAEKQLGEKFLLPEFHEFILQSKGPLNLLEERVDQYIKEQKQK